MSEPSSGLVILETLIRSPESFGLDAAGRDALALRLVVGCLADGDETRARVLSAAIGPAAMIDVLDVLDDATVAGLATALDPTIPKTRLRERLVALLIDPPPATARGAKPAGKTGRIMASKALKARTTAPSLGGSKKRASKS